MVLLFSYIALLASEDFSDERPQVKCVFSIDMSSIKPWETEHQYTRFCNAKDNICQALEEKDVGKWEFGCGTRSKSIYDEDLILGKYDVRGQLEYFIFLHAEYAHRSRSLHLMRRECDVYGDPNPVHMVLSWKYVETVFKRNDEILKDNVIRLGVIITEDNTYSFYNIFETSEEKEKGEAILRKIQTIFVGAF